MSKNLTDKQKALIWSYRYPKPRLSFERIAKKLHKTKGQVQGAFNRMKKRDNWSRKKGSGRKRCTTRKQDREIVLKAKRNPFISNQEIKEDLNLLCSQWTIGRRLREANLKSYYTAKKPFISETNRKKRLKWAKLHVKWTAAQWKRVVFSDESPFTVRYQRKIRVRRPPGQRYNPRYLKGTVKHPKKINVWGCFSVKGVGKLHLIKGILEKTQMLHILQTVMTPSMDTLIGFKRGIFMQDNDPKHTSKICQKFLEENNINVLDWPAQSPDINPLENLWGQMDVECKDRKCNTEEQLFKVLNEQWKKLNPDYLKGLIRSMRSRCEAVIQAKGYPTGY